MIRLFPDQYLLARPLLEPIGVTQLAVIAILEQRTAGDVYVDDLQNPRIALARTKHRFHLGGDPDWAPGIDALRRLFAETIYPHGLEREELLMLFYTTEWSAQIESVLEKKDPLLVQRQHYVCLKTQYRAPIQAPQGFELRPVDALLLEQSHLENLADLQEEMCSERSSPQDFLEKSFGVCALQGSTIAGWCLSEYNTSQRCEIGIETRPAFRKRGLATALTGALVEEAFRRGLAEVGWDCFSLNVPSAATARKAGFTLVSDYTAHMGWYDPRIHAGVRGNVCLERQETAQALEWFEKSIALGDPLNWVLFGAARAAARLGQTEPAIEYAAGAVRAGMDLQAVQASEDLANLVHHPRWKNLNSRLVTPIMKETKGL